MTGGKKSCVDDDWRMDAVTAAGERFIRTDVTLVSDARLSSYY